MKSGSIARAVIPHRRIPVGVIVLLATLAMLTTGCGDSPRAGDAFVVSDSAGVEIVESVRPLWRRGEEWRLSPAPTVQFGEAEGERPELFHRVVGAAVLPDGTIVVANGGDATVRFYVGTGHYIRATGGAGPGPGRFTTLGAMTLHDGMLYAGGLGLVNMYDLEGNLARIVTTPPALLAGVFADGTMLLRRSGIEPTFPDGRWNELAAYYRFNPVTEVADSIALLPELAWDQSGSIMPNVVMFGPRGHHAVAGDVFVHGWNERFDIGVFRMDGTPVRRIRRAADAEPVSPRDRAVFIDAYVAAQATAEDAMPDDAVRRVLEAVPVADTRPAHGAILADNGGNLWVQRFSIDGYTRTLVATRTMPPLHPVEWDVFDTRGAWLGAVTMPAGFMPLDIGTDTVVGVHYDAIGIERIRVYTLHRGGAPE